MCRDDGSATAWELMTAARRFSHRLEVLMDQRLEHFGISFAQYRALETVAAYPDIHTSELARALRISRQGAGKTIEKLGGGALIDEVREAGRVYVTTSELGRKRLDQCRRTTLDMTRPLEEALTEGERHRVVALLERAARALRPPSTRREWWLEP